MRFDVKFSETKEHLDFKFREANSYHHPATHPASMILLDDGQDLQGFAEEVTEVTNNITPEKIGAAPAYTYGTTDLTAGESPLETGKLYFVYE